MTSRLDTSGNFRDLPWSDLKDCFYSAGAAEVKRRFASCMDASAASALDGNLQAAAIAFMAHGQHKSEHATTMGGLHHLFDKIRRFKADFDIDEVQNFVGLTKKVLFDMVSN